MDKKKLIISMALILVSSLLFGCNGLEKEMSAGKGKY